MEKEIFPPMHTAQHLINQAMVREFGCGRSFSDHIEKKKSKLDYYFDRNLTDDELRKVEVEVNRNIKENLEIFEDFIPVDEAEDKYNLSRINGEIGDKVRIIKIADYDSVPCKGPHVKNTKEIGEVKIISSDYNEGVLRLRYKLI